MRLATLPASAFASLLLTTSAYAQRADRAVEIGLRTGIALPGGSVGATGDDDEGSLSDVVKRAVPVILEANLRLDPKIAVGAFFQYGFASLKQCDDDAEEAGVECSSSVVRAGVQVLYTPMVSGNLAPWLGAGVGYEWFNLEIKGSFFGEELRVKGTLSGLEWLNLQAGLDVLATPTFRVGPFLGFSLGQYAKVKATTEANGMTEEESADIDDKAFHHWITLGVRGVFDIAL